MTDTDRLAELAAAATPGPWSVEGGYLKAGAAALTTVADMRYKNADANRDFIVALVNAYRDGSLVDDNRELRAALDETQRMLEYLWSATGSRAPDMPVYDLFNEDDPITDDILTVVGRARMLVHGATPAPRAALHPGDGA